MGLEQILFGLVVITLLRMNHRRIYKRRQKVRTHLHRKVILTQRLLKISRTGIKIPQVVMRDPIIRAHLQRLLILRGRLFERGLILRLHTFFRIPRQRCRRKYTHQTILITARLKQHRHRLSIVHVASQYHRRRRPHQRRTVIRCQLPQHRPLGIIRAARHQPHQ